MQQTLSEGTVFYHAILKSIESPLIECAGQATHARCSQSSVKAPHSAINGTLEGEGEQVCSNKRSPVAFAVCERIKLFAEAVALSLEN